jgi:hypothetical protein
MTKQIRPIFTSLQHLITLWTHREATFGSVFVELEPWLHSPHGITNPDHHPTYQAARKAISNLGLLQAHGGRGQRQIQT